MDILLIFGPPNHTTIQSDVHNILVPADIQRRRISTDVGDCCYRSVINNIRCILEV